MAKNSQTININFDASMDIKQVTNAVQSIGKEFDVLKSKMPQGLSKRFTSDLQKLEEELNNFASVSSGMKNLGDIGKADKSLEKIITLYRKLQQEVSDIGDIDISSFLPDDIVKKIEGANQAVKNYEKQIESLGKEAEASKKKVNELIDLKEQHKKLASDRTKAKTTKASLQPDKIEATAARDAAKVTLDKAKLKSSGVDLESQGYKDLIATYQQTQNALDEVNAKIKEQDNILKSTTAGLQKNENAQKSYSEVTQQFGTTVAQLKASLIGLGDAAKLTAFENLKVELEKIAGIDVSGLKQDLSNIDDVTSGISAEATKKVAEAIQKIQQNANGAEPAIDGMQDKLHQTGESAKELTRAAQEVERLKQQVLDFFSIGNAIQLFKRAVTSALETVKDLDAAMTETAVVTEFSVGDMWSQLPQYTKRANELGVSIKGAYEAATLYYQQGLKTNQVIGVSNETLKMARIANIEAADATNLMTAALRGFNMEVNETSARNVSDVYSNLAAITAADTEEIGIAMSKTASIAKSANMEFNTTAALLSQIIETTREAPETAGTAMKTIIARFTEVKKLISEGDLIGADEEGEVIDVNKIDTALKTVGISLKGFLQGTEGIDDIFLKLASKWDTLDISTQRYIATMAAGSRQQSRFLAMMGDYDRTMELVGEANNSAGASQQQFEKTLESMESKLAKLKNAWDEFVMGLANNDILKRGVDALTLLLNTVNSLLKAFSGGQPMIKTFLTGLLAVGAFKLGKSVLGIGKGGGVLGSILGTKAGQAKAGAEAGNTIGGGFVKGIGNKLKGSKDKTKNYFKEFFVSKGTVSEELKLAKEAAEKRVQIAKEAAEQTKQAQIKAQQDVDAETAKNGYAIIGSEANQKLAAAKQQNIDATNNLKVAEGEQINVQQEVDSAMSKTATNMQTVGVAATALGVGFNLLASLLDNLGADDSVVEFFSTLGMVLMAAGAVMPIVSSAFSAAGTKIAIAGLSAQAAWWWVFAIIAAVGVIIGLVVAAAKAAKEASLAGQLEKAQKATEAAKESADSAKEAYSELLSAKEEYTGLQDTLENLTKGTNEWKQALIEANSQVLKLLSTYPELAKFISRGEDGQLTISDEGFDSLIEKQQASMQRAQAAAVASQMNETRIQGKMNERQLAEKFQITTDTQLARGNRRQFGQEYAASLNQGYLARTGSDKGIVYNQQLMDQLRGLMESGDLSDAAFAPLAEANEQTIAHLRELTGALNEYDAALLANQVQLESQAEALLTAGASQETLNSDYNKTVVSGFAKRMTTDDYAKQEEDLGNEVGAKDGTKREELLKAQGLTATGDQKKDTQALYASLAGLKSVEDIPADLKDNTEAMAAQIGKMLKAEDQVKAMEGFQKKLNAITDKDIAKNIAGLMSGDASQFTKEELGKVGNLSDYAAKLGYANAEEMAGGLGYTSKTVSALDKEDQQAYAKQMVGEQGDLSDTDYQKAIDDWIAANGAVEISAEVQMNIDSDQYKAEMEEAYNKATAGLAAKGVTEGYGSLSIDTVKNLSAQVGAMSNQAAQDYVANFNKVLSSSDLGASSKKQLETYLSTVDWTSMTDAVKAMDYMQEAGVDPAIMKEYWDSATDGAHTFVSTLAEALSLIDRLQKKMSGVSDIAERLAEGSGTYEDMNALIAAGADISGFQLTAKGWRATTEEIEAATGTMRAYYAEQAKAVAEQNRKEFTAVQNLALDNSTTFGRAVAYDRANGTVTSSKDFADFDTGDRLNLQKELQVEGYNKEKETFDEYLARLEQAYNDRIASLENGDENQLLFDKLAAYQNASQYTASENEARGGSDESIIYSAQNEAVEAGIDPNEMMEYAAALQSVHKGLSDVTAAEVALYNSRMNAGLGEIIGSYSEWTEVLDENTGALKDTSAEGVATYNKLKDSVNKMLNTSEDLSDAFWDNADNMKLIKKAAEGDTKALGELQKIAAKDYLLNLGFEDGDFTEEGIAAIQEFADWLDTYELPTVETGDLLDDQDFIQKCNEMITASNMTAEQISNAFKSMGYDVKIKYQKETRNVPNEYTERVVDARDEQGYPSKWHTNTYQSGSTPITADFPVIETLTSTGSGGGGISVGNQSAGQGNTKKGGGGGGGSKKKETWENPYDELYNLTEKVNESLRQREKIERDYDRLLKNREATSKQILANSLKEIANLRKEIALQKQLQAGRSSQISKLGSKTYKEKSFSDWGVTKYASYDEKTGTIKIDWEAINKITDTEIGAAVEAYISKLEELSEQFEETQDTIEDMEDIIREIQERGKTEYVDFEQRIYDALVAKDQEVIDNLSEINDSINDSNARLLDSIQTVIDEQRQARKRDEQRNDIEEKQRRLALLKSDTSGANALEIKALEEEISDLLQSYTDSLVDDSLAQLQQQNDDAAEQRERQIEIMQNQLDYAAENGAYWEEVSNLLSTAFNPDGSLNNNSALVNLLKETEGFKALSEFGGMQWIDELIESWLIAQEGLANWKIEKAKQTGESIQTTNAGTLTYDKASGLWLGEQGEKYSDVTYDPSTGLYTAVPYSEAEIGFPDWGGTTGGSGKIASLPATLYSKLTKSQIKTLQEGLNELLEDGLLSGYKELKVDGIYGPATTAAVKELQAKIGTTADGKWGKNTHGAFKNSALKAYKSGGLADFTGPAWMDGTKTDPELVLNGEDTRNFLLLKDVLSDTLSMNRDISQNNGDNYFEVHIEVDKLESDYDVEQVANKVKRIINEDARYRNVNAINVLR